MFDMTESYSYCNDSFASYPIVKPNIRTGEGRSKCRPLLRHKVGDQKKKAHRKMAKKSRRANRR
jgi:hypothetical protein